MRGLKTNFLRRILPGGPGDIAAKLGIPQVKLVAAEAEPGAAPEIGTDAKLRDAASSRIGGCGTAEADPDRGGDGSVRECLLVQDGAGGVVRDDGSPPCAAGRVQGTGAEEDGSGAGGGNPA